MHYNPAVSRHPCGACSRRAELTRHRPSQVLDHAVFTFEVSCGDAVSKSNGYLEREAVAKVQAHVLKVSDSAMRFDVRFDRLFCLCQKFAHDAKSSTKQYLKDVMRSAMYTNVYPLIHHALKSVSPAA